MQVRLRVHVEEGIEVWIHRAQTVLLDEHRVEPINEGRGRRRRLRSHPEHAADRRNPINRSDWVENVESRYGRIVVPERREE